MRRIGFLLLLILAASVSGWLAQPAAAQGKAKIPAGKNAPVATRCEPGASALLKVRLHPQETDMWCWAASGQMVMSYLGHDVNQCTQANNRFGMSNCPCAQCGPSQIANPPCVLGGWPEFDKYGFKFARTNNTPLTWDQIRRELSENPGCGKTPIAFSWHWAGGGGHMMVIVGYSTIGNRRFVHIFDPWTPCQGESRIVPYEDYVSGSDYTHWDDFYRIRPE